MIRHLIQKLETRYAVEKLGLLLREDVPVDTFRGVSFFRTMEFMVGFAIIGFMVYRYGQLIRRQIVQKRAEDAFKGCKKEAEFFTEKIKDYKSGALSFLQHFQFSSQKKAIEKFFPTIPVSL